MKFAVLVILVARMCLQASARGVCDGVRVERAERSDDSGLEREESSEDLEKMWTAYRKINCSRENLDAATTLPNGYTFFFKDDFYWRMYDKDVDPGYPRKITQDWDYLPGKLDAALTWTDKRTFFFKGSQYWSFHGKKMDRGYPRRISEGFCGIPDNVDAALLWKKNNKAYFFKGDQYWRFDGGESRPPVPKDYPMSIKEWKDIPGNVDAALQWRNGRSYFFKGAFYYRYDDDGTDETAGRPVLIQNNWGLSCSELNSRIPSP